MKTKHFFYVAMLLIASFSMTWIGCQKDNETTPDAPTGPAPIVDAPVYDYPADFPGSDKLPPGWTIQEVQDLYNEVNTAFYPEVNSFPSNEVSAKAKLPVKWKLINVAFKLRTNVIYSGDDPTDPSQVVFMGHGKWKEVGGIDYYEKVSLWPQKKLGWPGTGVIRVNDKDADDLSAIDHPGEKAIIDVKNKLTFISGLRKEYPQGVISQDSKELGAPNTIITSQIRFIGGNGIFKDTKGKAYKVEHYFENKPFTETFVYGFVWIRVPGLVPSDNYAEVK